MMFTPETYKNRRDRLRKLLGDGLVLFMGNTDVPYNYLSNTYSFRQDSSFLYFWGLNQPGMAAVMDIDEGSECLFGDDSTMDDIIWMGQQPSMADKAASVAVSDSGPYSAIGSVIRTAVGKGRKIHFLPPYRSEIKIFLSDLLGIHPDQLKEKSSVELIKAVVKLRSVKEDQEIAGIETAVNTAYRMHTYIMKNVRDGMVEQELAGAIEGISLAGGGAVSFPVILSVSGQILHNHYHGNVMRNGRLLLTDAGAENSMNYASDITRTVPVGGKFSETQKVVYNTVLRANMKAIEISRPGVLYRDVHLAAARVIADGLKQAGIMKGDIDDAVSQGAHALFFPHGLGHMMGLDVHDMENLGENYVGYDEHITRSKQFGLSALRMGRKLEPGFVVTDEPGIYFIPALIDQWEAEKKFTDFINYDLLKEYRDFGGVRIEDDLLITETGCRVLGKPIPKTVEEVEGMRE